MEPPSRRVVVALDSAARNSPDNSPPEQRAPTGASGQSRFWSALTRSESRIRVGQANQQKRRRRKGRSESVELELVRIKMHERLLLNDQRLLVAQLRAGPLAGAELAKSPTEVKIGLDEEAGERARPAAAIECRELSYQTSGIGGVALQKQILHKITLAVPEGSIYGLLGPSGCGKTTLLRCVAGRLQPSSGSIRVFGYAPNEPDSGIPGPAIGYMPQEASLYEEFTIHETLAYFGRINRMRAHLLEARIDFLLKFLNLPDKCRLIRTLSGGQKRRVSLAVAMVHSPPLLILDEPTVGVDPLLRQIIWNYLVTLATSDKITIIITTHYIEEARQANIVGLMRDGHLLAADCPHKLMLLNAMSSLEQVFLKLCIDLDYKSAEETASEDAIKVEVATEGDQSSISSDSEVIGEFGDNQVKHDSSQVQEARRFEPMKKGQKYAAKRVNLRMWLAILAAVTWKNYLRLKRNPPVVVFEFLLPAFQLILFCLCIGGQPFDIPLAIVNEEQVPQASRLFLNSINRAKFIQVPQANLSSALESVRAGRTWAAVHIPDRYTQHLQERLLHPADVSNETLANSTISVYPDLTNLHLALAIEGAFRDAFVQFARSTLDMLGYDPQLAELPVRVAQPIYGRLGDSTTATSGYLEFMAPGVMISITYVMATGLTALAFILEKRDGLLERSQISGVSTTQILLAHALLQVSVMVFQIALVLAVTFLVFAIPCEGQFLWVVLLVLAQGCTGMAFGLLISAVCKEENAAIMMLVGTFYINLILSGIMWPVEAMPRWLRMFSYAQPQTIPSESLRNILSRGWPITNPAVYSGFAITLAWMLLFLLGAGLCMRYIK